MNYEALTSETRVKDWVSFRSTGFCAKLEKIYIFIWKCFLLNDWKIFDDESWTVLKIKFIRLSRDVVILDIVFKSILTLTLTLIVIFSHLHEIPSLPFDFLRKNYRFFPLFCPEHSRVIEPLSPTQLCPFIGPQWTSWYLYNFDNNEMCCPLSLIGITVPRQIEHCVKYFQTNAPREFN